MTHPAHLLSVAALGLIAAPVAAAQSEITFDRPDPETDRLVEQCLETEGVKMLEVPLWRSYLAGCILLGIAPCTAMVLVWGYLAKGNDGHTLVMVAINSLAMLLELQVEDKQAMLEAKSLAERRKILTTLLEFTLLGGDTEDRMQ